jgi:hypothetical protein
MPARGWFTRKRSTPCPVPANLLKFARLSRLSDPLPTDSQWGEVLDEGARVIGAAGDLGQRATPGQDDVNRGGRSRDLLRAEDLPEAHDAIPGEGRHGLIISKHRSMTAL